MPITFHEMTTTAYPSPGQAQRSVFIDADNDGDIDVLYQAVGDGTGWLYGRANGDGTFNIYSVADSPFQGLTFPNHSGSNFFVMDVDGDGDMDLRAGANGTAGSYYRNDGAGDFTSITTASFPVVAEFGRQVVGDFDGDGDADILYQSGANGSAWMYAQSNGDGTYAASVAQGASPFAGLTLPDHTTGNYYVADFDGDGDADVWAAADGASGSFFRNDAGTMASADASTFPAMGAANKAVVADFDGDGDADILFQTGGAGSAWGYAQSNGDGTFTQMTQAASPFAGVSFVDHTGQNYRTGDLNNDGRIDIVGGVNGSSEEVYYQATGGVVINEVQTGGATLGDEFVELLNTGASDLDISGWTLVFRGASATSDSVLFTFPAGTIIEAGGHLLIANNSYDGLVPPDFTWSAGANGSITAVGGGVALRQGAVNTAFIVDSVVWGTASATHQFREGAATPTAPGVGQSLERSGADTDANGSDFVLNPTPTPQRSPGPAGTAAPDNLDGGDQVDTINGLEGDDIINGGLSGDILSGGADNDSLRGEDGDDTLNGDDGADVLVGGAGTDTLHGGVGDDELKGGLGADLMYGGVGDDHYHVTETGDVVTENGGEGYDTVHSYLTSTYNLGANVEALEIELNGDINGNGNFGDNVISAKGGANVLNGSGGDDHLWGGAGDDTLNGGDDDDTLQGEAGNDAMYGDAGDDILWGGAGADTLDGGEGLDALFGGGGNDTYIVHDGDFTLEFAGGGVDLVKADITWTLESEVENLLLTGTDAIDGYGNDMANVITGNDAANVLDGGSGKDTLVGGGGNDRLVGGSGVDRLTGGTGADQFVIDGVSLRLSGLGAVVERDTILDFSLADGDRIDLSELDANIGTPEDEAFAFVSHFTGQAGQATLIQSSVGTLLRIDVDGDGKMDAEMLFQGVTVTASDDAWIL